MEYKVSLWHTFHNETRNPYITDAVLFHYRLKVFDYRLGYPMAKILLVGLRPSRSQIAGTNHSLLSD
jgi:hypothetical protein